MKDIYIGLIGVGGTLIGTALGFFLNVMSNRGKLIITRSNMVGLHYSTVSEPNMRPEKVIDLSFEVEFYNTSNYPILLKDVKIEFVLGKKRIVKIPTFKNYLSVSKQGYGRETIIVRGKELTLRKGRAEILHEELDKFDEVNFIYLNQNNKEKKIKLIDFQKVIHQQL